MVINTCKVFIFECEIRPNLLSVHITDISYIYHDYQLVV